MHLSYMDVMLMPYYTFNDLFVKKNKSEEAEVKRIKEANLKINREQQTQKHRFLIRNKLSQ